MKILKRKNFNVRTYMRTSNPLERLRSCNLHFYIILRHSRTFQSSSFFFFFLLLLLSSITSDFRNVVIRSCRICIYVSDRRLNDYARWGDYRRIDVYVFEKKNAKLNAWSQIPMIWIQRRQRLIVHAKHEQSNVESERRRNLSLERTLTYNDR